VLLVLESVTGSPSAFSVGVNTPPTIVPSVAVPMLTISSAL
jgi:hypothetical protein